MKTEASEAEKEADRQRMGLDGYEVRNSSSLAADP